MPCPGACATDSPLSVPGTWDSSKTMAPALPFGQSAGPFGFLQVRTQTPSKGGDGSATPGPAPGSPHPASTRGATVAKQRPEAGGSDVQRATAGRLTAQKDGAKGAGEAAFPGFPGGPPRNWWRVPGSGVRSVWGIPGGRKGGVLFICRPCQGLQEPCLTCCADLWGPELTDQGFHPRWILWPAAAQAWEAEALGSSTGWASIFSVQRAGPPASQGSGRVERGPHCPVTPTVALSPPELSLSGDTARSPGSVPSCLLGW